jgi:hypothetical protein
MMAPIVVLAICSAVFLILSIRANRKKAKWGEYYLIAGVFLLIAALAFCLHLRLTMNF